MGSVRQSATAAGCGVLRSSLSALSCDPPAAEIAKLLPDFVSELIIHLSGRCMAVLECSEGLRHERITVRAAEIRIDHYRKDELAALNTPAPIRRLVPLETKVPISATLRIRGD